MAIRVYPPGTTDYAAPGVLLSNVREDRVTVQNNGRFDLAFECDLENLSRLEDFSILVADTPEGEQPFVFWDSTLTPTGVQVEARHVSFLLELFSVSHFEASGGTQFVLETFGQRIYNTGGKFPIPFEWVGDSDLPTMHFRVDEESNAFEVYGRGQESIVAKSGGVAYRDGWRIGVKKRLGRSTEILLAKRKNVQDVALSKRYDGVVTELALRYLVDLKELIPVENGQGIYNSGGSRTGGVEIELRNASGSAELLEDGEGSFTVYDRNGYRWISNMQTGSHRAITSAAERKAKWQEDLQAATDRLADLRKRHPELIERRDKLRDETIPERVAKEEEARQAYYANQTAQNRERFANAKKSTENARSSLDNAEKQILNSTDQQEKTGQKIDELSRMIATMPAVVPGKRRIENILAPGDYVVVQHKAPDGFLVDPIPRPIKVTSGSVQVLRFSNLPVGSSESQDRLLYETVKSPLRGEYPYVFRKVERLNGRLGDVKPPTVYDVEYIRRYESELTERMKAWGQERFARDHVDLPADALELEVRPELGDLRLGDTCVILYEDYKIYKELPLTGYVYRPVQGRFEQLLFGQQGVNLASQWARQLDQRVGDLTRYVDDQLNYQVETLKLEFDAAYDAKVLAVQDELERVRIKADHLAKTARDEVEERVRSMRDSLYADLDGALMSTTALIDAVSGDLGTAEAVARAAKDAVDAFEAETLPLIQSAAETVTAVTTDVDGLKASVYGPGGASRIELLESEISTKVTNGDFTSYVSQTAEHLKLYARLTDIQGLVRFTDLDGSGGSTIINGSVIQTGTIGADRLKVTGGAQIGGVLMFDSAGGDSLIVKKLTAAEADIGSLRAGVLEGLLITADMIQGSTAIIDKLFATTSIVNHFMAKDAVIRKLQAIELKAEQLTTGVIRSANHASEWDLTNGRFQSASIDYAPGNPLFRGISISDGQIRAYTADGPGAVFGVEGLELYRGTANTTPVSKLYYNKTRSSTVLESLHPIRFEHGGNLRMLIGDTLGSNLIFFGGVRVTDMLDCAGTLKIPGFGVIDEGSMVRTKRVYKSLSQGYCTINVSSDLGVPRVETLNVQAEYNSTNSFVMTAVQPAGSSAYNVYVRRIDGSIATGDIYLNCVYKRG